MKYFTNPVRWWLLVPLLCLGALAAHALDVKHLATNQLPDFATLEEVVPTNSSPDVATSVPVRSTPITFTADDFLDATNVSASKTSWVGVVFFCVVAVALIIMCWSILVAAYSAIVFRLIPLAVRIVRQANNKQIVLGVGLLLVILNGLFPPIDWDYHQGYCFLFAAPNGSKIIFNRFFQVTVSI